MLPTVVGVALIVFFLLRFAPGDVADLLLAETQAANDPEVEAKIREDLGLDGSPLEQFIRWSGQVLQGDLGTSYYSARPVGDDLSERLPVTVQLGLMGLALSVLVGIPIGAISALRQDDWADYLLRGGAILFLSVPTFWLALLVLQTGREWFGWAPPARYVDLWDDPAQNLYIMITPAIILGIGLAAVQARYFRAQMLEVLRQDYIRTARAKGLHGRVVLIRHAFRNASIPVITIIGLQVPVAITGTIILEQIFLIPGVGRLLIDAARRADYPIVQAITLVIAIATVFVNLLIDLSYGVLDPRIREGYR